MTEKRRSEEKLTGLERCEAAFERLSVGVAVVPAHVGISPTKITRALVSKEAGLDAGYLKPKRLAHRPLIAKIDKFVENSADSGTSTAEEVRRAKKARRDAEDSRDLAESRYYRVLALNLALVERVKELESEVRKLTNLRSL